MGDFMQRIIAQIIIKITYYLTLLIPVRNNRVSFISYFSAEYGLEFSNLHDLLAEANIEIKCSLQKFDSSWLGKLKYLFQFIYQTYLFNTSRVILLDGNSLVHTTIRKKKNVKVIQLWHALGAIKKFGTHTKRRYPIKGYDALIVSSQFFRKIFAESLDTKLSKTLALGYSKSDYLFDEEYQKQQVILFNEAHPALKDKKLILYAPTFRGSGIEDMHSNLNDIEQLSNKLKDDYQIMVKLHPLVKEHVDSAKLIDVSDHDLYQLLFVSDIVISDYSALIFDAMVLRKKVLLHLYDLKKYRDQRGLSVNISDMKLQKSYNIEDLYFNINNLKKIDYDAFNDKYLDAIDGHSSERIVEYILKVINEVDS